MKRGLKLLVLSLVIGVFLVEFISAQVNYALSGNPSITNQQVGSNNYLVWRSNNAALNDGSVSNAAHGVTVSDQARYVTWGSWDSIFTFSSPISQLNSIDVVSGIGVGVFLQTITIDADVYSGGSWHDAGESNLAGILGPTQSTYTYINGAPWNNVEQIRVSFYAVNNPFHYVDYNVYEIRAWGPNLCTTESDAEFCSRLGRNCGTVVSDLDNCGNARTNIDCGSCNIGESCLLGTCVSSGICSDDDDRIMRLSAPANAHGSLWNDVVYTYDICYSDIFGVIGNGNHDCTGNNKILGLHTISNSHAQSPTLDDYLINVCYGDLNCQYVAGGACPADYSCVVTLHDQDNSHLADCDSADAYPDKICCRYGVETSTVYWADMQGNIITEDDSVEIGDSVLMVYDGVSSEYDFEVFEDDSEDFFDDGVDEIRTNENAISSKLINGKAIAKWTITADDFDKGNSLLDGEFFDDKEEFYFIVNGKQSEILNVGRIETNDAPTTQIILPVNLDKYLKDAEIGFEQTSRDKDDALEIIWDFGDGNTEIFENCFGIGSEFVCDIGDGNTLNTYFISGTKNIVLTAKEMTREQRANDYASILIYQEGMNIFPIITEPDPEINYLTRNVPIDASSSYISKCNSILADCVTEASLWTTSWNTACYEVADNIEIIPALYCFDYPTGETLSGYDLYLEWTFDPEDSRYISTRRGYWNGNYNEVVESSKVFQEDGYHTANLIIGYKFDE